MGNYKRISVDEVQGIISDDTTVVDVRDPESYSAGHLENSVHLSNENIHQFVDNTDKSKPVIVYCYRGNSSQDAATFLCDHGFLNVYSMDGGFEDWIANDYKSVVVSS